MLGYEDEDSMDRMEIANSPPPLSPQAPPLSTSTPPPSPPGKSVTPEPEMQKIKKLEKEKSKLFKTANKIPVEKDLVSQLNGNNHTSDSDNDVVEKVSKKVHRHEDGSDDKISKNFVTLNLI